MPDGAFCRYDHGGDIALARGLYEELWNQVEKYRPGGKGLTFDFRVGTASFSDWYLNYKVMTIWFFKYYLVFNERLPAC